jgi:hypothetical protein
LDRDHSSGDGWYQSLGFSEASWSGRTCQFSLKSNFISVGGGRRFAPMAVSFREGIR